MCRLVCLLLLALGCGACGGGDAEVPVTGRADSTATAEERFAAEAGALCEAYNLRRVQAPIPSTRREQLIELRRAYTERLDLLDRLAELPGPAVERRLLGRAIRAQRRALSRTGPTARLPQRGWPALLGPGLERCAELGAYGLSEDASWKQGLVHECGNRIAVIELALRRSRELPEGSERVRGLQRVAQGYREASRPLDIRDVPEAAKPLEQAALRELRRTADALEGLADAIGEGDAAVRRAGVALERTFIRGDTAWYTFAGADCGRFYAELSKGF